jgi:hypothetical protein
VLFSYSKGVWRNNDNKTNNATLHVKYKTKLETIKNKNDEKHDVVTKNVCMCGTCKNAEGVFQSETATNRKLCT